MFAIRLTPAAIVERIATGETTAADAWRAVCRFGRAALRPLDVRPKAEPRKNESEAVVPTASARRDPPVVGRPEP